MLGDRDEGTARDRRSRRHPPHLRLRARARRPTRGWSVGLNEAEVLSRIDREIMLAYLQLGFFGLLVLLLAWFGGERLIVEPIRSLARTADAFRPRRSRARAPPREAWAKEFEPLAAALNDMAQKLAEREQRAARRQPASDGARLDRRAVRPRQPPRLRRAARSRMAARRQARPPGRAADDRRRPLQAVQRPLRPCRGRRLPAPHRQAAARDARTAPTICPRATAARNSRCCCPAPTSTRRWRSPNGCAARSRSCASRTRRRRCGQVTVSVGVASLVPGVGEDAEQPDRGRRRRPLCRQAARPQHGGRARRRGAGGGELSGALQQLRSKS